MEFNSEGMFRASRVSGGKREIDIYRARLTRLRPAPQRRVLPAAPLEPPGAQGVVFGFHDHDADCVPCSLALYSASSASWIRPSWVRLAPGRMNAAPMLTVSRLATRDASCGMLSSAMERWMRVSTSATYSRRRLVQDHGELLAAVARDEIHRPARALAQRHRDRAQALVARLMPVAVVVVLEAIDVDQQHGHPLRVAHRLTPGALDVLIEHAAVLNAGQAVAGDHLAQQRGLQKTHTGWSFRCM